MVRRRISEIAGDADLDTIEAGQRHKTGLHGRGRSFLANRDSSQQEASELQVSTDDCRLWEYNDRIYAELNDENCKTLKEDIQLNTQLQPVVARKDPAGEKKYEVIVGTRRFWACQHIPAKTIKILLVEADDKQAYKIMRSENQERDDTSTYEKAMNAKQVISNIYEGNQKSYCLDNNIPEGTLSGWMAIAEMEPEIITVIPSRLEIGVKQASRLRSVLNKSTKTKKAVLSKARTLRGCGQTTSQIFKQLIEVGNEALPGKKIKAVEKTFSVSGDNQGVQVKEEHGGAIKIKISKKAATDKKAVLNALTEYLR